MQLEDFFLKIKMDSAYLSIDFDSWNELPSSLMTARKLVQEIQVLNATVERGVAMVLL